MKNYRKKLQLIPRSDKHSHGTKCNRLDRIVVNY